MSALGGQEIIILAFIGLLFIIPTALWIWSLVHCITNKRLSDNNRIIGIVLIVCLSLLGSLIYLFLPRENPTS
ncbi:PLDc N-terminal domain-containing protein [Persicirhabdus sediminis]|uniref:PLDc N-terminal domain-containing protein n=1 Tax=Persicirhabdus sediminis TaxID=454144 RepID=A0A8J7MEF4_9BACT|nr:PLDc N-terminal domain-containing protein [Persicirhabdus sediminis]MBK1791161.1 PLDc N-terminal domain-containing protein [Persicirhabdus sediminis]